MASPFPLTGLRSVDLTMPDLSAAVEFYTGIWGLHLADRSEGTAWLRATGEDPHVLALHGGGDAAIRSMTFRAAAGTDLSALAERMAGAGADLLHAPRALHEHGGGTAIAARDPRGRTIRVVQGDDLATPLPPAADRPERLAHVNINSTDVDADARFLEAALGFRLTDRSGMMAFERTNSDHHSVVIAAGPVNGLNHVAFQHSGWEGVMRAAGRMVDAGFLIGWGPGRHGPGDNVFVYFVDPFGFVIEHTSEVLQVDDEYRVRGPGDWTWPPGRTDQWGICPPKTAECKAAQIAIPFS
ncbi:VOC family protein (plasmid) [Croceibacterium sp. TMG7-5b_MA50]|uniref:VOC family protein n=1 Tax=Croceibacterium sp. TMG7-5b_MA50 TaxID=3121290 RepID=UPI003221C7E4